MTPQGRQKLINLIKVEEGFRQFPYEDSNGYLTIGYGHNLNANGLSESVCSMILNEDIDYFLDKIHEKLKYFPFISENRKIALVSMVYNLGVKAFMDFSKMHLAMEGRNWRKASEEILQSKAAHQCPSRYKRIAYMILQDEYVVGDAYGTA